MAFYEVKRVHTDIEYFEVEASNEDEARTAPLRDSKLIMEAHSTAVTNVEFLFESDPEDWKPEDEEDFFPTHPYLD